MRVQRKGASTREDATTERSSIGDPFRTILGGRRMVTVTVGTFAKMCRRSRTMPALMVTRTEITACRTLGIGSIGRRDPWISNLQFAHESARGQ